MHSHTLLVNKTLGLGTPATGGRTPVFIEHGYTAHAIERSIRVKDKLVAPDAIFLNAQAGHLLVVDCKSGPNVRKDQDLRYSQMTTEDVTRATRSPRGVNSHTFAYAIDEAHLGRIRSHTDAALIVFGHNSVRADGDLGHAGLTQALRRGASPQPGPNPRLVTYPFSVHDADADIDRHVAAGLAAYLGEHHELEGEQLANNAVALGVLRTIHPHHRIFAPSHRAELVGVTRRSILRLCVAGTARGETGGAFPARAGGASS